MEKQKEIKTKEELKNENWVELTSGNIIKFEEKGQTLKGDFVSIEQSKEFKDSWLVKISDELGDITGVFCNKILKDLIEQNNVMKGERIKIVYDGMKETEDKKFKYHSYKLFKSK